MKVYGAAQSIEISNKSIVKLTLCVNQAFD